MKKEVLIAIIIGLITGLFITYGFYHSQRANQQNLATSIVNIAPDQPETKLENGKLTIFSPDDEIVIEEQSVQVAGKTTPNSLIVIYVNNNPEVIQADETGNFTKTVELESLANIITIHAFDEEGEHNSAQRTVVVYDQELIQAEAETEANNKEDE